MKEKSKKVRCLLIIIFLWLLNAPSHTLAADNTNGGQVGTEAIVTFYEETIESSSQSQKTEPSVEKPTEKPKGRLPSTGELIKGASIISGMLILGWVLLVFFKKRKHEDEEASNQ